MERDARPVLPRRSPVSAETMDDAGRRKTTEDPPALSCVFWHGSSSPGNPQPTFENVADFSRQVAASPTGGKFRCQALRLQALSAVGMRFFARGVIPKGAVNATIESLTVDAGDGLAETLVKPVRRDDGLRARHGAIHPVLVQNCTFKPSF